MRIRSSRGFTLVEMLVAITIFAIITLGIVPLMLSSMRGATLSRSYTIGKNVGLETMEHIRGLPYFVSVQGVTTPTRRDVLDLFFPDMGAGYSVGSGADAYKFTTVCNKVSEAVYNKTPAASASKACPSNIPPETKVTVAAQFVEPVASGATQTYEPRAPLTGYSWSTVATETAKTPLLKIVVSTSWTTYGRDRSFDLTSLIGERNLSSDQIRGQAKIDYVLLASTGFTDGDGRTSHLEGIAGELESNVETKTVATADQTSRATRMLLTENEFGVEPATTPADFSGANATLHAPPNSMPAAPVSAPPLTSPNIVHPGLDAADAHVGYFGDTSVNSGGAGVQVANELPKALGSFAFTGGVGSERFWIDNPLGTLGEPELGRDDAVPVLDADRVGSVKLEGSTSAEATALIPAGSRKVESLVTAGFARVNLLPITLPVPALSPATVVSVSDFTASLQCKATANATAPVASGTWSAKLTYWGDITNEGTSLGGAYREVLLSGSTTSTATDPLLDLKAANPLVLDRVVPTRDVHLFQETNSSGEITKRGYLTDAWSRPKVESLVDAGGRSASVNLNGAIQLNTVPVNPDDPESGVSLTVGAMSCQAVDKRGT